MNRLLLVVTCVLAEGPVACRAKTEAPPPQASAVTPAPVPTERAVAEAPRENAATTLKLARCGWGAAGANASADAVPWVIALLDVELPGAARGLHITAMELAGASGIAAKMSARSSLRVQEGALGFSFSAAGTRDVGDALGAGSYRLRAAAALDRGSKAIGAQKPTTCSVALTDDSGRTLIASGNADPEWQNEI